MHCSRASRQKLQANHLGAPNQHCHLGWGELGFDFLAGIGPGDPDLGRSVNVDRPL